MIRYEIKKIFSKTICRISMIVLLLSLIISCYFAITNITYIDEQGVSHAGIAAARDLRTEKQKWEGTLDEEALQKVLDEYRKRNEEYPILKEITQSICCMIPKCRAFQKSKI